jgi:hypothetical protein
MMLSTRKRVMQTALFAMLSALLLLLGTRLCASWQQGQRDIADSFQNLDQLRSIATYAKSWKPSASANGAQASSLFLPEAASAIVEANLLASIKVMAAQSAVEIARTSSSPPRPEGGIIWHDVTVDVTGTSTSVLQLLAAVENTTPALFVERLQISSSVQPGVTLVQEPVLSAEITISGATKAPIKTAAVNPP